MRKNMIDLNGIWKLRWMDGQRGDKVERLLAPHADWTRAWDAMVPGCVHLDLIRHGILAEPATGLNCLSARWVEEMIWHYSRHFYAPRLAAAQRAFLIFEGLDLAATVYLNGRKVGRHANAFYPCRLEVTEHLAAGDNHLLVQIESGLFHAMDRSADGLGLSLDSHLTKRPWLRKSQSSHGWDWAARLLNVGICGGVRLEIVQDVWVEQVSVRSDLADDLQTGVVTASVSARGLRGQTQDGQLRLYVAESGPRAVAEVRVPPGDCRLEAALTVPSPQLWWPVGHGRQPLYDVRVELWVGGKKVSQTVRRVGFRHVRFNQAAHREGGTHFILEINHKPIFCKGGNFVLADMIPARVDRRRYSALVDRALEANFNFLRVWGGGLYEHDDFYDLCAQRGILVWQEFIFACAKYPATDEKFLADVASEATYQVRRLAHHTSLIAWCGNNEMEQGAWEWGYERGQAYPDYALFHLVLPRIMTREDPGRHYQPSSPFSPGTIAPNADTTGDQHPWSIGFANTNFYEYRKMVSRFPNEGGILGPTALPTLRACLEPKAARPGSFAWEIHDNSIAYWGHGRPYPDVMLEEWLGRSLEGMTLDDYAYWGGVVQGEGLGEYVRNFRRRSFSSAAAIFWMYNDCWPTTRSWTIVDYYLRRTPAFWPVRRAMAPVAVVVVREGDVLRIFGVNEESERSVTLHYGLLALAGGYPFQRHQTVLLPANASTVLAEFDAKLWDKLGLATHAAFAILRNEAGHEIGRDRLFLPRFKDMRWPRCQVRVAWRNGQAIFRSSTFAWRVCLDLDGEKPLPDNFFDIYPGIDTVLPWPKSLGRPQVLRVGNDRDRLRK